MLLFVGLRPGFAVSPITLDVDLTPKATPGGILSLKRVALTFDNGLPRAAIGLNGKLGVQADILYSGNGPLVGQWLVDGKPLQTFNTTLTFGDSIVLKMTDLPPLPSFEPGFHDVSVKFFTPSVAFKVPVIRYAVDVSPGIHAVPLILIHPVEAARLDRPRSDSLVIPGKSTLSSLSFTWKEPVVLTKSPPVSYQISFYDPEDLTHPLVSARLPATTYTLPPLLAERLPMNRPLLWQVKGLDKKGQMVAASGTRQIIFLPPSSIELLTPTGGILLPPAQVLAWNSPGKFDHYEVRVYLDEGTLLTDMGKLFLMKNAPASAVEYNGSLFRATSIRADSPLITEGQPWNLPGLILHWIVIGFDQTGTVTDASESGNFHLPANVATLNGLPVALQMGKLEIGVNSYQPDATLAQLSGNGSVRSNPDLVSLPATFDFQGLNVEAYIEQSQVPTEVNLKKGSLSATLIQEVLKGRVLSGNIAQTFEK
ncbi:MAG: hypothetical protein HY036_09195 [Nitrospirae bacterium]|nr:hypothetical protein [Nitrospirota bacterium]